MAGLAPPRVPLSGAQRGGKGWSETLSLPPRASCAKANNVSGATPSGPLPPPLRQVLLPPHLLRARPRGPPRRDTALGVSTVTARELDTDISLSSCRERGFSPSTVCLEARGREGQETDQAVSGLTLQASEPPAAPPSCLPMAQVPPLGHGDRAALMIGQSWGVLSRGPGWGLLESPGVWAPSTHSKEEMKGRGRWFPDLGRRQVDSNALTAEHEYTWGSRVAQAGRAGGQSSEGAFKPLTPLERTASTRRLQPSDFQRTCSLDQTRPTQTPEPAPGYQGPLPTRWTLGTCPPLPLALLLGWPR